MSFSSQAAVAVDRGSFSRNWASFWFDAPLGRRGDDSPWRCGYLKTSTTSSRHRGSEVALVMMMLLMRMMMMMMMVVVMMMVAMMAVMMDKMMMMLPIKFSATVLAGRWLGSFLWQLLLDLRSHSHALLVLCFFKKKRR